MTFQLYRTQVAVNLYNDPNHNTTNTLYFIGSPATTDDEDWSEISARLEAAWHAIDGYLQSCVGSTATVTAYRMSDPMPRIPWRTGDFAITVSSSPGVMPADAAAVISFASAVESGDVRARHRGRIYFGPIAATAAANNTATNPARLAAAFITAVGTFVTALTTLVETGLEWAQYSSTLDVANPVVTAWIDNQIDTRRSRDQAADTRTTWGPL